MIKGFLRGEMTFEYWW